MHNGLKLLFFAVVTLVGCHETAPQEKMAGTPGTSQADAHSAQPISQASANSAPTYQEMRLAAVQFAHDNFAGYRPAQNPEDPNHYVDDCQESYENAELVPSTDPTQDEREALARRVAKQEFQLGQVYRHDVFAGPLRTYELRALALVEHAPPMQREGDDPEGPVSAARNAYQDRMNAALAQLADELERRRSRLDPQAPPIQHSPGCGAGEQPYMVRTVPSGGRVWLTTKFSFDLCTARHLDPWNVELCRWTELDPQRTANLSGRYVFQARWRGGANTRGIRVFDGFANGDDEPVIVNIRPG